MSAVANVLMAAAFLCALASSGGALLYLGGRNGQSGQSGQTRSGAMVWLERGQFLTTVFLSAAVVILAAAFARHDFSLVTVAGYSDYALPLFYRLTALWAGQEGSLLFWAWSVAVCGSLFAATGAYSKQPEPVKLWFWAFFAGIMAFFLFLLTSWSNPFLVYAVPPADGNGMNPMLQNPGMIFHPPLLFLGYGGFAVPGCLALACALGLPAGTAGSAGQSGSGNDPRPDTWAQAARPFILTAWIFLSAGIILGAWWAYMELGWGGYWAWDPVENASLIPWLIATACLHTAIVEERRGKLGRTNIFLMALTTISAFFATYIVRGNVVRSVHAFGDSATGGPLLLFTALFLALAAYAAWRAPVKGEALESPLSREGLLAVVAWLLLALAVITLLGTLWPVLSRLWSAQSIGLGAAFFNYTCLPFFALLALMLAFCPWIRWDGGFTARGPVLAVAGLGLICALGLAWLGLTEPLPFAAAIAGVCVVSSLSMLFCSRPGLLTPRRPRRIAAHGTHLGLALMVLGVSFSGPYKVQQDVSLQVGQSAVIGDYAFTLHGVREGDAETSGRVGAPPAYVYLEADIVASRNAGVVGILAPQLRRYVKNPSMPSAEACTLFSPGNELYATFLGMNGSAAVLRISINPLVNWIWAGGVLLCLFPFFGIRGGMRRTGTRRTPESSGGHA